MKLEAEAPLRKSLFSNVPPFLNYLPNGRDGSEAGPSEQHREDVVAVRFSLWRVPIAFNALVTATIDGMKEQGCKESVRMKRLTKPDYIDSLPTYSLMDNPVFSHFHEMTDSTCVKYKKKGRNKLRGCFYQRAEDPKTFIKEHNLGSTGFSRFSQITRKDWLWHYYEKMLAKFGRSHFDFLTECVMLPAQKMELAIKIAQDPKSWWIVKPPASSMGKGVFVINSVADIPQCTSKVIMVQRYLPSPYLINGCKFDLRIYVLITSVDPLRIYVYDEGLARFCVHKYTMDPKKIKDTKRHVCNYDVNKTSRMFTPNEDPLQPQGHKWTLTALWKVLASEGKVDDCLTIPEIKEEIDSIVVKSVLCGVSSFRQDLAAGDQVEVLKDYVNPKGPGQSPVKKVKSSYNKYRLLGYDILMDSHRRPHLIEINSGPACHGQPLDRFVNRPMIAEMFKLVGYHVPPGAVATPERAAVACRKLNIPTDTSPAMLGFNPKVYSNMLNVADKKKQEKFPKNSFERELYKDRILDKLTRGDVRILVKTLEELSQTHHFTRVFPSNTSHQYFQYLDSLPYYDKLLDAFELKYSDAFQEGVEFVNKYCQNKKYFKNE